MLFCHRINDSLTALNDAALHSTVDCPPAQTAKKIMGESVFRPGGILLCVLSVWYEL